MTLTHYEQALERCTRFITTRALTAPLPSVDEIRREFGVSDLVATRALDVARQHFAEA